MKTGTFSGRSFALRSVAFTLMESVIAIGVVGVLLLSLYAALTTGFRGVQLGREDMRATQILVRKMDQLRLLRWDQVTNSAAIPATFLEPFNPENPTPTSTNAPLVYCGAISVVAFADPTLAYGSDMREIRVQLSWISQTGLGRNRSFSTFVARNGLQNYIY
jgi:type II secretory pathway pseudopilin PulG